MTGRSFEAERANRHRRQCANPNELGWKCRAPASSADQPADDAGGHAEVQEAFLRWFDAKLEDRDRVASEDDIANYLIAWALGSI